jgi:hypothetical protein
MVQLPAVNTPQFDVARSRMAARPRPLGKVYQPELAAQAIVWASEHRRRELWVGLPTEQAILGTRVAPGLLDWILARRAVGAQQAPLPPAAQDNLFTALPGDRGMHGRFSSRAATRSPHLWAAMHAGMIYAAMVLGGLVALFASMRRKAS